MTGRPLVACRSLRIGACLAAGAAIAAGAPGCGSAARSSVPGGEGHALPGARARSAAAFGDSFGVNVHLFYNDTPYRDAAAIASRLGELHIRHIRDGLAPDRADDIAALQLLGSAGIRADLLLGTPGSDPQALLDVAGRELGSTVEAIEGPNEYWRTGGDWRGRLKAFESRLYSEARETRTLRGRLLVDSSSGVGAGSTEFDVANFHPYPGGRMPEMSIAAATADVARQAPGKAIWATETGYDDALDTPRGAGQPPVSDLAQAVYVPRLFASYFAAGVSRTYLYELVDEFPDPGLTDAEKHFGLLDNALQPKPQFRALARLVDTVRDAGAARAPRGLHYQLADQGGNLRQLLLSRSDGSWQLLLWRAEPVDAAGKAAARAQPVVIELRTRAAARVARLTGPRRPARLGTARQFTIPVGAALVVVDLRHPARARGRS